MKISITRLFLLILGGALLIAGVGVGIVAMQGKDLVLALFGLGGIVVGFFLVSGQGITVTQ